MPTRRNALLAGLAAGAPPLMAATSAVPASAPSSPSASPPPGDTEALRQAVAARERAFAATMARRDLAAFAAFVSEEAVFANGGQPLTGRAAIVRHWSRYFEGPAAPFAWEPDLVTVLASGRLASTTGPVTMPDGTKPSRFQSTWRLEDDGAWRVVFDTGYRVCPPSPRG